MGLDRFAVDAPADDALGDARACVVATRPDTFERCREGFYPAPRSYDRTRAAFDYMAFYRTAPVSAITHRSGKCGREKRSVMRKASNKKIDRGGFLRHGTGANHGETSVQRLTFYN